ncbi:hypothetical protein [uncultured Actinomyces sp.]|uniref:hypothetical protein n=1 Tax=uncultured Actinomyces sp. TaxID=249061 RepID=UPI0025E2CE1D|nr:hypothetical protein [uncultured Actinomyces sp.]
MPHEGHPLATRDKAPLSLRQHLLVLISTSALLLACLVLMHMNLASRDMSPLRMGMLIVGDTGLIGMQLAAFLVLYIRWRRTRTGAAGPQ